MQRRKLLIVLSISAHGAGCFVAWVVSVRNFILKITAFIFLVLIPAIATAETLGSMTVIESKPINELWLNPGFYSYHFQTDKGLNNRNIGLGGEYRYSTVGSITLGMLDNSNNKMSHYAGWYWQPLALSRVRLGAVMGVIDGYPKMQNGGWFVIAIPTASIEYKRIEANLLMIPGYKDKLYGSLSLQLKFRVF